MSTFESSVKIVEYPQEKVYATFKYETTQSPVPFNLWVQLLPVTETTCKMKLTIKADLNPFIKGMISGPLNEGLEKLAETLAHIQYE